MSNFRSILAVFPLIFVVVTSGCTGTVLLKNANEGDNASTNDGMYYVQGNTTLLAKCSKTSLLIANGASYSHGKLNLTLINTGDVDIDNVIITITYGNSSVIEKEMAIKLTPQALQPILLGVDKNIEEVIVKSKECAGAWDRLGKYDIFGLSS